MASRGQSYKKSLATDKREQRLLRVHRRSIDQRQMRHDGVNKLRQIQDMSPIHSQEHSRNPSSLGTPVQQTAALSRLEKLKKWKEEKELKRKLEAMEKARNKPSFIITHLTHGDKSIFNKLSSVASVAPKEAPKEPQRPFKEVAKVTVPAAVVKASKPIQKTNATIPARSAHSAVKRSAPGAAPLISSQPEKRPVAAAATSLGSVGRQEKAVKSEAVASPPPAKRARGNDGSKTTARTHILASSVALPPPAKKARGNEGPKTRTGIYFMAPTTSSKMRSATAAVKKVDTVVATKGPMKKSAASRVKPKETGKAVSKEEKAPQSMDDEAALSSTFAPCGFMFEAPSKLQSFVFKPLSPASTATFLFPGHEGSSMTMSAFASRLERTSTPRRTIASWREDGSDKSLIDARVDSDNSMQATAEGKEGKKPFKLVTEKKEEVCVFADEKESLSESKQTRSQCTAATQLTSSPVLPARIAQCESLPEKTNREADENNDPVSQVPFDDVKSNINFEVVEEEVREKASHYDTIEPLGDEMVTVQEVTKHTRIISDVKSVQIADEIKLLETGETKPEDLETKDLISVQKVKVKDSNAESVIKIAQPQTVAGKGRIQKARPGPSEDEVQEAQKMLRAEGKNVGALFCQQTTRTGRSKKLLPVDGADWTAPEQVVANRQQNRNRKSLRSDPKYTSPAASAETKEHHEEANRQQNRTRKSLRSDPKYTSPAASAESEEHHEEANRQQNRTRKLLRSNPKCTSPAASGESEEHHEEETVATSAIKRRKSARSVAVAEPAVHYTPISFPQKAEENGSPKQAEMWLVKNNRSEDVIGGQAEDFQASTLLIETTQAADPASRLAQMPRTDADGTRKDEDLLKSRRINCHSLAASVLPETQITEAEGDRTSQVDQDKIRKELKKSRCSVIPDILVTRCILGEQTIANKSLDTDSSLTKKARRKSRRSHVAMDAEGNIEVKECSENILKSSVLERRKSRRSLMAKQQSSTDAEVFEEMDEVGLSAKDAMEHCSPKSSRASSGRRAKDDLFLTPGPPPSSSKRSVPRRRTATMIALSSVSSPEEAIKIIATSPMVELTRRTPKSKISPELRKLSTAALFDDVDFTLEPVQLLSALDAEAGESSTAPALVPDAEIKDHSVVEAAPQAAADVAEMVAEVSAMQQEASCPSVSTSQINGRDVSAFKNKLQSETRRLNELAQKWKTIRESTNGLSEEVDGQILSVALKAELLTGCKGKFSQFGGLVEKCEAGDPSTTPTDLQGFWDMIHIQAENIYVQFDGLDKLQQKGWAPPISTLTKDSQVPKKAAKKLPVVVTKKSRPAVPSKFAAFRAQLKRQEAAKADEQPVAEGKVFDAGFFKVNSPVHSPKFHCEAGTPLKCPHTELEHHGGIMLISTTDAAACTTTSVAAAGNKENAAQLLLHRSFGATPGRCSFLPVVPSPLLKDSTLPADNLSQNGPVNSTSRTSPALVKPYYSTPVDIGRRRSSRRSVIKSVCFAEKPVVVESSCSSKEMEATDLSRYFQPSATQSATPLKESVLDNSPLCVEDILQHATPASSMPRTSGRRKSALKSLSSTERRKSRRSVAFAFTPQKESCTSVLPMPSTPYNRDSLVAGRRVGHRRRTFSIDDDLSAVNELATLPSTPRRKFARPSLLYTPPKDGSKHGDGGRSKEVPVAELVSFSP